MKYFAIVVTLIIVGALGFATLNTVSHVSWGWWGTTSTTSGVALEGHDPVAYFDDGVATKGDAQFSYDFQDATWHFASEKNKNLFTENPEMYAPQFGGFCAFAVSKGFTAKPTPAAWHIEGDKLYVFADENVRDEWVETIGTGSLEASKKNWANR